MGQYSFLGCLDDDYCYDHDCCRDYYYRYYYDQYCYYYRHRYYGDKYNKYGKELWKVGEEDGS